MDKPEKIAFADIDEGERGRKVYNRINELADGIEDIGLIQPIVLVFKTPEVVAEYEAKTGFPLNPDLPYLLNAGGRRYRALTLLQTEWVYHAASSFKGRPGYILKGEATTYLHNLLTEIAENLDRENLDWRDEMRLIVKAYRLAKAEANQEGQDILMRDFGATLGVGYANLGAAVAIHDDVTANPKRYAECTGIRAAYALLLKSSAQFAAREQATKSLTRIPLVVPAQNVPKPDATLTVRPHIHLTQAIFNQDAFSFMSAQAEGTFDHIYTDPDYAVSVERLAANAVGMEVGVVQDTIEQSLEDLKRLIGEAWRLIRPQGFFVFWCDMDHWNPLQHAAIAAGFRVQRWPLIWHKLDYRSNAAPSHNFCKNIEYAMVCRKPNAVLVRAQSSCVYSVASSQVQKDFHHPFAKPLELHKWIISAISVKGQILYDPFGGSMTIPCAAADYGLRPVATESNHDHYTNGLLNIQRMYKKILGTTEVDFS